MLLIHLLRHYSTLTQEITSENRSLTPAQLQQAIDYIHTHLDRDLSLAEVAGVISISPTYFASLFKRATGISPHQYVIQQRVERAKLLLTTTDLAIADIALQVGFSGVCWESRNGYGLLLGRDFACSTQQTPALGLS